MSDRLLVVFVKPVVPGKVKTRLASSIGNTKAAAVYQHLQEHTKTIIADCSVDIQIHYSEQNTVADLWSTTLYKQFIQDGNSLGERMSNAFNKNLLHYKSVVLIGSDCMEITSAILDQAFTYLKHYQCAIGPAKDGGYYLIGLNTPTPDIFKDINWSSESVLQETTSILGQRSIPYKLLEQLSDIDDYNDLLDNQELRNIFL